MILRERERERERESEDNYQSMIKKEPIASRRPLDEKEGGDRV